MPENSARIPAAGPADRTAPLLALMTTVGFFAFLGFLAGHEVPAACRDLVNIMLGALASGWTSIVGYYFGSSLGHQRALAALAAGADAAE